MPFSKTADAALEGNQWAILAASLEKGSKTLTCDDFKTIIDSQK